MAFARWTLEHITWDHLFLSDLVDNKDRSLGPDVDWEEKDKLRHKHLLDTMFPKEIAPGTEHFEPWERIWWVEHQGKRGYESFKAFQEETLQDIHCGDCTYSSCPCSRCHSETLYEIPSSVSWSSGSEGNRMLAEYLAQNKEAENE